MIHSFLLIGQSNAAGRGFLSQAKPLDNYCGKIKVLRNGRWQPMFRPVNPDREFSGTCFAESFAREYLIANPDVEVGIIPCADGGTCLKQWLPGELLFDYAVSCAKLAMRTSILVGILWHQGESDCAPERYSCYAEHLKILMDALRKELNIPDLPILVGGLGDFLSDCAYSDEMKNYPYINDQLKKVAREYPNCKYVSAEGLGANPDNLHFNASALDEFGVRYYKQFKEIDISRIIVHQNIYEESDRTELEVF